MKHVMAWLGMLLIAGCATPPPRPTAVDSAITGEVDKAIARQLTRDPSRMVRASAQRAQVVRASRPKR
jgi:hypothetical protein